MSRRIICAAPQYNTRINVAPYHLRRSPLRRKIIPIPHASPPNPSVVALSNRPDVPRRPFCPPPLGRPYATAVQPMCRMPEGKASRRTGAVVKRFRVMRHSRELSRCAPLPVLSAAVVIRPHAHRTAALDFFCRMGYTEKKQRRKEPR